MLKYLSFALSESLTNLWRSRILNMLSIGTIGFAMFTLSMFLFLGQNLKKISVSWENHIQFQIFLTDDITTDDRLAIEDYLEKKISVQKIQFLSKEEARQRFQLSFKGYGELTDKISFNPFPASFSVHLLKGTSEHVLEDIFDDLNKMKGIDELAYNREIYEKLDFFARLFQMAGWFFGGIMILASIFTISNVLKLTFFTRREEVDIMKLVGASHSYIRGPFIFEGLFQGLLGSFFGLFFSYMSVVLLRNYLNLHPEIFLSHLVLSFLSFYWIVSLLLAGCLAGVLGSLFSLKEFLHEHISY
jgi:cell division transport system permease protein